MKQRVASTPNDYFYAPSVGELGWIFGSIDQDTCRTLPPLVSAGGNQDLYEVRLPNTLTLQGEAHGAGPRGDVNLTSIWTEVSGPAPVAFTDPTSPVTNVLFTDPGTYILQLEASDGFLTTADRATVTVDPAPSLQGANLAVALSLPGPLVVGTPEALTATLTDAQAHPIGNFAVQVTVTGANPIAQTLTTNASGVATFAYTGAAPGTDTLQATAFGGTAQLAAAPLTVTWTAASSGSGIVAQGWLALARAADDRQGPGSDYGRVERDGRLGLAHLLAGQRADGYARPDRDRAGRPGRYAGHVRHDGAAERRLHHRPRRHRQPGEPAGQPRPGDGRGRLQAGARGRRAHRVHRTGRGRADHRRASLRQPQPGQGRRLRQRLGADGRAPRPTGRSRKQRHDHDAQRTARDVRLRPSAGRRGGGRARVHRDAGLYSRAGGVWKAHLRRVQPADLRSDLRRSRSDLFRQPVRSDGTPLRAHDLQVHRPLRRRVHDGGRRHAEDDPGPQQQHRDFHAGRDRGLDRRATRLPPGAPASRATPCRSRATPRGGSRRS